MTTPSPSPGHQGARRRSARNLRKKPLNEHTSTPELPVALQEDSDSEEEPPADDSAPVRPGPLSLNVNQSLFSLIAAAGSRIQFNERFDDGSSDDEAGPSQDLTKTVILSPPATRRGKTKLSSGHRLLKSLSTLPRRSKSRGATELGQASSPLAPSPVISDDPGDTSETHSITLEGRDSRLPSVMSRMLQAQAEMSSRPSFDLEQSPADADEAEPGHSGTTLASRLMDIFGFDEPEEVIEEYPCWLLQSVLLQGYLYITVKHICFYAYLPKKANVVSKSGYLGKRGRRNPKYNRYWFRLKGDVFSYYDEPTNLYFPHGQIDLRYGISASVVDEDGPGLHFQIVASQRTYNFKADSRPSAKEWVKSLQRVIFRSHNEGDSVKISLPIQNVMDVEETQMMSFSDTCKIRVIDNDETFAIDEYFFAFFTFGREAINVLKNIVEDASSSGKQTPGISNADKQSLGISALEPLHSSGPAAGSGSSNPLVDDLKTKFPLSVKATFSPKSTGSTSTSPRVSHDVSRSSLDSPRQTGGPSRETSRFTEGGGASARLRGSRSSSRHSPDSKVTGTAMDSSYSNLHYSTDDPSYSGLEMSAAEDPSASQILRSSDVFRNPNMRRSASSSRSRGGRQRDDKESPPLPAQSDAGARHAMVASKERQPIQMEHQRPLTPTLQTITKMGSYPLQRAGAFAGYLNKTSKRVSSLLATESMGYVEKVSGMWRGGHKHYNAPPGLRPDEDELEEDSEGKIQTSMQRFRDHFALPSSECLKATYYGYILRVLPLYGKIYISDRSFCFRSLLPGTRTMLILPLEDIETAQKEKGFRFGYSGLVIVIRGHEEIFFEFNQATARDDCGATLLQGLETNHLLAKSGILQQEDSQEEVSAMAERDALRSARQIEFPQHDVQLPREAAAALQNAPTIVSEDTEISLVDFKPPSMRITCLTIGSRGDVQPYIALCKGLMAEGHKTRIATHAEFQDWIESHGIEFCRIEGDPSELMRLCIQNGTFTMAFLLEANATFRGWLDELLVSAWHACQGTDLLIESPSTMAGIHIAEKLGIPYFRAFTMPWTRTRSYPHAFAMPEHKMGGAFNMVSYILFENVFWRATANQINRWRNKTLGLPNTSLSKMQPNKVPFLYNFSPSVVPPPIDFSDWIRVTGYWFLDEANNYQPPEELENFIKKARADGKKLVYVGFGSIIVPDPVEMTHQVIGAVQKADVRCILSKGWSDRLSSKEDPSKPRPGEPPIPPEIHVIKSAPHDWLFRQVDAVAHHGGSGTTGASLRAGVPTIIRAFFGDQFFYGSRVEDLDVGVWVKQWSETSFGRALWQATRNERMKVKARVLGEQIRKENGVTQAIQNIYRDLEYARGLIKCKTGKLTGPDDEEDEGETEESWTFVGRDELNTDMMTKKLGENFTRLATAKGFF